MIKLEMETMKNNPNAQTRTQTQKRKYVSMHVNLSWKCRTILPSLLSFGKTIPIALSDYITVPFPKDGCLYPVTYSPDGHHDAAAPS